MAAQCGADLRAAIGLVERNYAGFHDKLERIGADTLNAARENALRSAATAGPDTCRDVIAEWLRSFADRHLFVAEAEPEPATPPASTPPAVSGGELAAPEVDSRAPSFERLTADAALLRVPSFSERYETAVERLVAEHRDEIAARPQLILDLRGNSGGSDATYETLADIVYTDPVREIGLDLLASPENVARWEALLPTLPPGGVHDDVAELLERMRAQPGGWVSGGDDRIVERKPWLPNPAAVAIVIDGSCASSCEQFLLEARASRKVRIFGQPSKGVLDYANVLPHPLPSGRVLGIPTSRTRRLPAAPVDGVGITVDVPMDPTQLEGPTRKTALEQLLVALAAGSTAPVGR